MRRILPYLLMPIVLVGGGFFAGWYMHSDVRPKETLPVLDQAPDYTLTNQLGQAVSSSAFKGKVRVVTFLFTYCRGYCPLIAHNFMTLEQLLRTSGMADQVQLVAFNVDPKNTGPTQMKAFQQQYGWDPENHRWEFLTGSPKEIRRVVTDGYHVYFQKVTDDDEGDKTDKESGDSIPEPVVENKIADEAGVDYDIIHNDMLAIVDAQGRIRKVFGDADRVSDKQILDVIQQLLYPERWKAAH